MLCKSRDIDWIKRTQDFEEADIDVMAQLTQDWPLSGQHTMQEVEALHQELLDREMDLEATVMFAEHAYIKELDTITQRMAKLRTQVSETNFCN